MVRINNTSVIKEIRQALGASISDGFPQDAQNVVIPVLNVNPKDYRLTNAFYSLSSVTTGAASTLTNASRDTYITNAILTISKNATCDIATGSVSVTVVVDGQTRTIARLAVLTLTAEYENVSITFARPIKVDRNSTISVSGTYTAGLMSRGLILTGYEVEPFESQ